MTVQPTRTESLDPAAAAEAVRQRRAELLAALADVSESQLYRPVRWREGWTLRHALSSLAAADAELERVLEALGSANGDAPPPLHLRRARGEAMHEAHGLRLPALREHLQATSERIAQALAAAGPLPQVPVATDRVEAPSPGAYLASYLHATEEALRAIRERPGR